jgi:60 kDa SS-A/Ro ribonucleoprotein
MANKQLFASGGEASRPDAVNEASGPAHAFSPEHALAQLAVTGTFQGTFYADAQRQLDTLSTLFAAVSPELVAKTAIYCRQSGRMKDMPAFLVAHLAVRDVALMSRVFARVIDDARMLRNFVQIVRSGVTGRKSFGSAPKRALRRWFADRSPDVIFRQSIGQSPSMSDVIKMVRPSPKNDEGESDAVREALYGYLIGKNVDVSSLPPLARACEAFKRGEGPVPDVPFEMLTALPLRAEHWVEIAKKMTVTQLRMNLNTLLRHGVLDDPTMVDHVVSRLTDREAVRRARVMPYQLLAAYRHVHHQMPSAIVNALAAALEIAVSNVPELEGNVVLCPDVSGSMHSPLTGARGSATTTVRCLDVAALVSAAVLRKSRRATVLPFSDDVVAMGERIEPLDSVMTNAERLAKLPAGGTACAAPLRWLNARGETPDLVVIVSDNQSWADFRLAPNGAPGQRDTRTRGTVMAEEWEQIRARTPNAKLVLVDVQPYTTTQVQTRDDVLNVGGFSDAVFDVIASFARGELGGDAWLRTIESVSLD